VPSWQKALCSSIQIKPLPKSKPATEVKAGQYPRPHKIDREMLAKVFKNLIELNLTRKRRHGARITGACGKQVNRLVGLALKAKPSVDFGAYWQRHVAAAPGSLTVIG
jgi:hypothetical protein